MIDSLESRLFDAVLPADDVPREIQDALLQLYADLTEQNRDFDEAIVRCYAVLKLNDDIRRINPRASLLHECRAIVESNRADYAAALRLLQTAGGLDADLFVDSDANMRRAAQELCQKASHFVELSDDGFVSGTHDEQLLTAVVVFINESKSLG